MRSGMKILLKLICCIFLLNAHFIWAEERVWSEANQKEYLQEIPLNDSKFQPINRMVRTIPSPDFDFEPAEKCLCAISACYKPEKGKARMWVTKRSWFSKPDHVKKFDRMVSILDRKGDVN